MNEKIMDKAKEANAPKVRHIWEKNPESGKWIRKCQVDSAPDFSENKQSFQIFLFETLFQTPKGIAQPRKG
jgi:hypothetical protein